MPKLVQRLISVGPFDNETYRRLTKVAKFNGHESVEEFLTSILNVMLESDRDDDEALRWETVALRKADHDFAVERWQDDYRVMLDQALGDSLDVERAAKR